MTPACRAINTASSFDRTWSVRRAAWTWARTSSLEIPSHAATTSVVAPVAAAWSTSRSRWVKRAHRCRSTGSHRPTILGRPVKASPSLAAESDPGGWDISLPRDDRPYACGTRRPVRSSRCRRTGQKEQAFILIVCTYVEGLTVPIVATPSAYLAHLYLMLTFTSTKTLWSPG